MELSELAGIGKTRLKSLEEAGILSCRNLIEHTPRKYYNFSQPDEFVSNGSYKLIRARVIGDARTARIRKNFMMTTVKLEDSFGNVFTGLWYNQPYVKNTLKFDEEYFVYGKDDKKRKNTLVVSYYKGANKADGIAFFPVYKSVDGMGSEAFRHAIDDALLKEEINSVISPELENEFAIMNLSESYKKIHRPESLSDINVAQNRIALESIIPIAYASEEQIKIGRAARMNSYSHLKILFDEYKSLLPFTLTQSQEDAIFEIIKDLESNLSMNRLLEGDVGSGKTAVAMFCLFAAAKCGFQAVIMAPTEILARQHYELINKLFGCDPEIKTVYLSSSMTAAEERRVMGYLKYGMANIVVGSHSVFSKNVEYNNLALVVIDEQHKFGVRARAALQEKGKNVDTLTMSATPIPRSLALALGGSLDISVLAARPHAQKVKTNIVSHAKTNDMWNYLNTKIENGSKVFVVCPKIDDTEDDGILDSSSAVSVHEYLKNKLNTEVVLVHGKMKREDAEKKISDFKSGKSRCLVSTTIVEVGVDAKDADIMVIENASNFGLASLHQLRGRVGRDGRQAECYCVVQNDISPCALERLKFFKNNTDGFKIAEYDLESRGAGNVDGTQQHGFDLSDITLFSIAQFELAKKIVKKVKQRGESLNISDETYQKIVSKIASSVAMN